MKKNRINIALFVSKGFLSKSILNKINTIAKKANINLLVSSDTFKKEFAKIYKKKINWIKNTKNNDNKVLHEIKKKKILYAFSLQYRWKISKKIINSLDYFFNFHFGDIPNYRGHFPIIYAMLNKEKFITGTIHNINEKLDLGQIYKKIFIKNNNKTSFEIEKLMSKKFSQVFFEIVDKIFKKKKIKLINIKKRGKYYSIKVDINKFKEIKTMKELKSKTLAFDYPPYTPAFFKINKLKIYTKKNLKEK